MRRRHLTHCSTLILSALGLGTPASAEPAASCWVVGDGAQPGLVVKSDWLWGPLPGRPGSVTEMQREGGKPALKFHPVPHSVPAAAPEPALRHAVFRPNLQRPARNDRICIQTHTREAQP